jgi:SAM-dependent methyltransferase
MAPGSLFADVACGKGRHSRVLASLGMRVHGLDISANSIQYAQSRATARESYSVHDMRNALPIQHLDAAINIFTSFGYFDTNEEDQRAIGNIFNALKPGGWFIQDYLNAALVLPHLPKQECEIRGDVQFDIHKFEDNGHIRKTIHLKDASHSCDFQESVKIYSMEQLEALHTAAGFDVTYCFGNYSLESFAENSSPRIILVSQKPHSQNESGSTAV